LVLSVCNPGVVRTYPATEDINIDECISSVLPLIYQAGNPYFDWLFGGPSVALPIIESRMRSPESEISIRDTVVLEDNGGNVVGGFVAMTGAELGGRRRADAVAYLQYVGRAGRASLLQRMQESRDLFASVQPEEFYLSKVGVRSDARGRGHGRTLVERFLLTGAADGLNHFVLDVNDGNVAALQLYRSMGFRVVREASVQGGHIKYLTMRWGGVQ
jgi:ribosomal protein S18 acetylase RimI-like enzyme